MMYLMVYDYIRVLFLFVFVYTCLLYIAKSDRRDAYLRDAAMIAAVLTLSVRVFVGMYG